MEKITLREARRRKGWTQEELEAASGVNQTTISAIEAGVTKCPSFDTAMRLAIALGIRPERLRFGRSERDEAHA